MKTSRRLFFGAVAGLLAGGNVKVREQKPESKGLASWRLPAWSVERRLGLRPGSLHGKYLMKREATGLVLHTTFTKITKI